MRYISTRSTAEPRAFEEILLEGLAEDSGLYVPKTYPQFTLQELDTLRQYGYQALAYQVLSRFASDIPSSDLRLMLAEVYTSKVFGSSDITPLTWLADGELALLRLSNGPTLAFKDVPLQLLGVLMEYALAKRDENLNVLGATSGDTGSAAAYALKGRRRIQLFMLSPHGRMSEFQRRQMYTLNEQNIHNLAVNGTFDDCQAVVKKVNADADFKATYKIGAVNSINWARIAAQIVYYFYGYLKATRYAGEPVRFAVPSGNFGNALSGYIARQMGLPIEIIVCTNENDVLDEFLRTGVYRVRKGADVKVTSSLSMDIAAASNFERFMYDYVDRDDEKMAQLLEELAQNGEFDIRLKNSGARFGITSGKATESEVLETIREMYKRHEIIIDPHTAVAMKVAFEHRVKGRGPLIVTETAQPAKFEDTIRKALGFSLPVPKDYEDLAELPEKVTRIDPDPRVVKSFIESHAG